MALNDNDKIIPVNPLQEEQEALEKQKKLDAKYANLIVQDKAFKLGIATKSDPVYTMLNEEKARLNQLKEQELLLNKLQSINSMNEALFDKSGNVKNPFQVLNESPKRLQDTLNRKNGLYKALSAINKQEQELETFRDQYTKDSISNALDYSTTAKDRGIKDTIKYSDTLSANLDAGLGLASGIIQSVGGTLDDAANILNKAMGKQEGNGFTKISNALAKPFTMARDALDYESAASVESLEHSLSNGNMGSFISQLGGLVADQATYMIGNAVLAGFGIGRALLTGQFMSENNKQEQAEKLSKELGIHITASDIQDINNERDLANYIGAMVQTVGALGDRMILKGLNPYKQKSLLDNPIVQKGLNSSKNSIMEEELRLLKDWASNGLKAYGATRPVQSALAKGVVKTGSVVGTAAGIVGKNSFIEYGSEFTDELGQKISNGDFQKKSIYENLKDMHKSGKMGAYLGGAFGAAGVGARYIIPIRALANTEAGKTLASAIKEGLDKKSAKEQIDASKDASIVTSISPKKASIYDRFTNAEEAKKWSDSVDLTEQDKATYLNLWNNLHFRAFAN